MPVPAITGRPKDTSWIDDDRTRLLAQRLRSHERVQLDRHALRVTLDAFEVSTDQVSHLDLTVCAKY